MIHTVSTGSVTVLLINQLVTKVRLRTSNTSNVKVIF